MHREDQKTCPISTYACIITGLFNISQIYIYMFTATLIISSVTFFFNTGIYTLTLPLSGVLGIVFFKYINRYKFNCVFWVICCLAVLCFISMVFLAGYIYDVSSDGNFYHKLAIGLLNNEWNPLFQQPGDILNILLPVDAKLPLIYVDCYPKATWFFGASIYKVFGNIECGKIYTIICIFCSFGITVFFLNGLGYNKLFSILFSFVAALNPIALEQFDTFYVDGCLQLIIYILNLSFIINIVGRSIHIIRVSNALIFSCILIAFNIKFTGAFFVCFYSFIYFIVYSYRKFLTCKREWYKLSIEKVLSLGAAILVAVLLVGSSTYLTNYIRHGNIGYPITGEKKLDIIIGSSAFPTHNRTSNLFYSLFSSPENLIWNIAHRKPKLKIPFTYSMQNDGSSAQIRQPDIRITGFGPFFSGLLIIGLLAIGVHIFCAQKNYLSLFLALVVFTSFILCAIIKESWWARYAPYIYFVSLAGIYAVYTLPFNNSKIFHVLSYLLCIILLINNCYFLLSVPALIKNNKNIVHEITLMQESSPVRYQFRRHVFGTYFNLIDAGIESITDENIKKRCEPREVKLWRTKWCAFSKKSESKE